MYHFNIRNTNKCKTQNCALFLDYTSNGKKQARRPSVVKFFLSNAILSYNVSFKNVSNEYCSVRDYHTDIFDIDST